MASTSYARVGVVNAMHTWDSFIANLFICKWSHGIGLLISCSPLYVWACVCLYSAKCQRPVGSHMNELRIQLISSTFADHCQLFAPQCICTCMFRAICWFAQFRNCVANFGDRENACQLRNCVRYFEITQSIHVYMQYVHGNPLLELACSCQCY